MYTPVSYGSVPPMSTGIFVPTSFVPPAHNQGVSLAPFQGRALWKKFLPTTGSFFVNNLLTMYLPQQHLAVDVYLLFPMA